MTDVVVIGGGVVGAGTAYRLARLGAQVIVVDRRDDGQATAAGAGIVPRALTRESGVRDSFMRAACVYYDELIPQLAEDGGTDTGYEVVGGLRLAIDDSERALLAADHEQVGGQWLSGAEAQRLFPPLRADVDALYLEDVARVDGRRLRASLLSAVERRGGTVVRGSAELVIDNCVATGVRVDDLHISADAIVVATGVWSDALGTSLGTYPQRGQILHLEMPDDTGRWPVLMGYRDHYLLTFPDHRVVAGATREDDAGFDYRVTAGGLAKVIADAFDYAPGLARATVVETRVGFRPRSRDGLPILGALPGIAHLFAANGLGEYGLTCGPYAGALVANLVLGRQTHDELAPFSPARLD